MPPMNHSLSEMKSQKHFCPLRPFPSEDGKLIFHPTNPTIPTASSAESELKIHPTNPTTSSATSNFLFFIRSIRLRSTHQKVKNSFPQCPTPLFSTFPRIRIFQAFKHISLKWRSPLGLFHPLWIFLSPDNLIFTSEIKPHSHFRKHLHFFSEHTKTTHEQHIHKT